MVIVNIINEMAEIALVNPAHATSNEIDVVIFLLAALIINLLYYMIVIIGDSQVVLFACCNFSFQEIGCAPIIKY